MGTNCGAHPLPDTANQCDISVGHRHTIDNFCTYAGPAGNSFRNEYCARLSTAAEWGDPNQVNNGCSYDDCRPYIDFGFGCCNGCCGILGDGVSCERLTFTGNPVTCCLNDYACNPGINGLCFSDPFLQNTCSDGKDGQPNYRSIVSTDCQDSLQQYCTGTLPNDNPNSVEWLDRWTINNGGPGSCAYAIYRNMFQAGGTGHCFTPPTPIPGACNINPPLPVDSQGYFWGQQLINDTITRYTEQGFQIGALPGFPGFNPFQDFLYSNVCCPYPGLCQDGLNNACEQYTAQRISLNPGVAQWCGCHLPPGEYEDYSVKFNIPPECTPMCNRVGTIPIVGINAVPIPCRQSICLIDGVTVNLINGQVGGGIEFNQICSNCGGGQCSCIVSDTTIDISNSTIGGNVIPVSEGCGSLVCSQTNPGITGPSTIAVSCGTTGFNPYAQYEAEVVAAQQAARKSSILWTLLVIGAGLLLIFLIIFFIYPNMSPHNGAIVSTHTSITEPTNTLPAQPIVTQSSQTSTFSRNVENFNTIQARETPRSDL